VVQLDPGNSKGRFFSPKDVFSGFDHKVAYISDQQYPIEKADSEQVMNTVAALGTSGMDITLVILRSWRSFGTLKLMRQQKLTDFYGVNNDFKMNEIVSLPPTKLRLEKYSSCFVTPLWAKYYGCNIVYTRNPLPVFLSLSLGLKAVFETYRNYTNRNSALGKLLGKNRCIYSVPSWGEYLIFRNIIKYLRRILSHLRIKSKDRAAFPFHCAGVNGMETIFSPCLWIILLKEKECENVE